MEVSEKIINSIIWSIILGLVIIACLIKTLYNYSVNKKLFNQVKFCVLSRDKNSIRYDSLFDTILYQQSYLNIESKYLITKDDKKVVNDILTVFQRNMTNLYFNNQLNTENVLLNMSEKEYFMLNLYDFLNANTCEKEFAGYVMFNYVNNVDEWTACYSLTEYGVTYYKMNYIASAFLKNYRLLNKIYNLHNFNEHEEIIKGKIDTRKIEIITSHK